MSSLDTQGRPLKNLRISVTDRCNLRCQYCMPEEEYVWLPRGDLLSFEEMLVLVDILGELGLERVRLTGGEPLLRKDLPALIRQLSERAWLRDLALTTNGVSLSEQAQALYDAGLKRVTVSLDTLLPERFRALTRRDSHARVLEGIAAAAQVGFRSLKLNTVVMRGVNDDELVPLLEYGKAVGAEVRFIEYMDVGGATRWNRGRVFTQRALLARLSSYYGLISPVIEEGSAPAERFRLPDGTLFGVIASTTMPFCGTCDRSRLTADGLWYLCLYAKSGLDLRGAIRSGASREEIKALVASAWQARQDRGAEERLKLYQRGPLARRSELCEDPHLEMYTRGG